MSQNVALLNTSSSLSYLGGVAGRDCVSAVQKQCTKEEALWLSLEESEEAAQRKQYLKWLLEKLLEGGKGQDEERVW